jgi:hypothetical protein
MPDGMKGFHTILNGGKKNDGDRLEYTAHLLHMNPVLCTAGWIGIMLIYRFSVLKEPFPDFLDPSDFMKRPLFRQVWDYHKSTSYDTQYQNHKQMFDLIGFASRAVTHLGRGSAQREMFDHGISLEEIGVLARYVHTSQGNSYIVNAPSSCVVQHSDGHPSDPGVASFCPARYPILGTIQNDELGTIAPYIVSVSTKKI